MPIAPNTVTEQGHNFLLLTNLSPLPPLVNYFVPLFLYDFADFLITCMVIAQKKTTTGVPGKSGKSVVIRAFGKGNAEL
jgi:hypothetical protein